MLLQPFKLIVFEVESTLSTDKSDQFVTLPHDSKNISNNYWYEYLRKKLRHVRIWMLRFMLLFCEYKVIL